MKQHFQKPQETEIRLSLEEEAVLIDEVNTQIKNEAKELTDNDRVVDVAKGVGDVQTIQTLFPVNDETTQQLTEMVGEMIVAGTDSDPANLFEAIATEGISETASAVWDGFKEFFSKYFTVTGHWNLRIRDMEARLGKITKDEPKNKKIEVSGDRNIMAALVTHNRIAPVEKIDQEYKTMTKVINSAFSTMPNIAMEIAKDVTAAANTYSPKDVHGQVEKLFDAIHPKMVDYFDCFANRQTNSWGDDARFNITSENVFGNFSIQVSVPAILNNEWCKEKDITPSVEQLLAAIAKMTSRARVGIDQRYVDKPSHFEIDTPSVKEVKAMLKSVKEMVTHLISFQHGHLEKNMTGVADSLEKACGHAKQVLNQNKNNEGAQYVQILNDYPAAFKKWSKEPFSSLWFNIITAMYGHLSLLEKSIHQYE